MPLVFACRLSRLSTIHFFFLCVRSIISANSEMSLPRELAIGGETYVRSREDDRFHLQRYDDESLSNIKEFQYQALPKGKKRIRLLVLKSASEETPQIDCELIEADYGNSFHIPT